MSDLRTRKAARTRLSLAHALSAALADQPFGEIRVKAICAEAEVSEATFFNYFGRKQDLMAYLAHLWLLELGWHAQSVGASQRGLVVIEQVFSQVAKTCEHKPGVFRELLVWIARGGSLDPDIVLSPVEKELAFPELEGIAETPVRGIDSWLITHIEAAMKNGELPPNTLLPLTLSALLTMLLGVPMTLLSQDMHRIGSHYRQQLALLWAGTRAASAGR
ncbi:TetR family transcriptional regulator [Thiogranum longum]|uniref:TetR family transcriptional regulator n=1 Tax=Thiogranum longum TaxID=1537524 RepID=A0A4R1H716_9GAMM|nr:TetR family transcriptional regulator [Thiogranum longum]TCK16958.1 TetR family transcriptional regulator [Thiogranum longum]